MPPPNATETLDERMLKSRSTTPSLQTIPLLKRSSDGKLTRPSAKLPMLCAAGAVSAKQANPTAWIGVCGEKRIGRVKLDIAFRVSKSFVKLPFCLQHKWQARSCNIARKQTFFPSPTSSRPPDELIPLKNVRASRTPWFRLSVVRPSLFSTGINPRPFFYSR